MAVDEATVFGIADLLRVVADLVIVMEAVTVARKAAAAAVVDG